MKKGLKIAKNFIFVIMFLIFTLSFQINAFGSSEKLVILGGNSIGLKLDTGVYIAGKYQVQLENQRISPWKNSDIKEGDKILAYNGQKISSNQELLNLLKNDSNSEANLTIMRNNQTFITSIDIVKTKSNSKSLGLYIKDKMVGIGTLTFINSANNRYASLGHGIYDNNTILTTSKGDITLSSVESIKKSIPGNAGEKRASISSTVLGTIECNKVSGIYGKITNNKILNNQKILIAKQKEVKVGNAKIYTVIDGEKVESFDIKVINVALQSSPDIKGIKFEVTDKRLLAVTGGIIQGMSGSPIVQNGKLIGAVSHVCVDNPSNGYGMHIEWMVNDASY